jgi:hypothetical protein
LPATPVKRACFSLLLFQLKFVSVLPLVRTRNQIFAIAFCRRIAGDMRILGSPGPEAAREARLHLAAA